MTARQWLVEALKAGPRDRAELLAQAARVGIRENALMRAATAAKVLKVRNGMANDPTHTVTWSLPAAGGADASGSVSAVNPAPAPATTTPPRLETPPGSLARLSAAIEMLQRAGRTVAIWRIIPGAPHPGYVTSVAASDFSLEWVKRWLGGGRFVVEGGHEFAIEGPPKMYVDPYNAEPMLAGVDRSTPPAPDINDKLFALVLEQLKASQVRATVDPLEAALRIVTLIRQQEGADKPAPAGPLEMLRALKELGVELGDFVGEGTDGKPPASFPEVLKEYAPALNAIAAIITKGAAGAVGAAPGAPALAAPQPTTPVEMLEPVASTGARTPTFPAGPLGLVAREIAPHLGTLVIQARAGAPPKSVADYLLSTASDETYGLIDEAVNDGNFVGGVVQLLTPHIPADLVPWFTRLAEAVRGGVLEDRRQQQGARSG
jgi:hypothetical protein